MRVRPASLYSFQAHALIDANAVASAFEVLTDQTGGCAPVVEEQQRWTLSPTGSHRRVEWWACVRTPLGVFGKYGDTLDAAVQNVLAEYAKKAAEVRALMTKASA
jgi:hypothetical protein